MKRVCAAIFVTVCAVAPASATTITWSSTTLSDDNAGVFLAGASVSAVANVWTLQLPAYSVSGNFAQPPDEVDASVTATASGGNITGVTFRYFGLVSGPG